MLQSVKLWSLPGCHLIDLLLHARSDSAILPYGINCSPSLLPVPPHPHHYLPGSSSHERIRYYDGGQRLRLRNTALMESLPSRYRPTPTPVMPATQTFPRPPRLLQPYTRSHSTPHYCLPPTPASGPTRAPAPGPTPAPHGSPALLLACAALNASSSAADGTHTCASVSAAATGPLAS